MILIKNLCGGLFTNIVSPINNKELASGHKAANLRPSCRYIANAKPPGRQIANFTEIYII